MITAAAVLATLLAAVPALATNGIDVSQYISESSFQCLANEGWDFAIVRGWHSYGGPDTNAPGTIANAWHGGLKHVDAYMFPCASKSASDQVKQFKSYLDQSGAKYGTLWFDVESNPSTGCQWSSNKADACQFMQELVDAAKSVGGQWGVYTSVYEWETSVGAGCKAGSELPLWYAHYDDRETFSDFPGIGGWTKPAMKQYNDKGAPCNVAADVNWYP